ERYQEKVLELNGTDEVKQLIDETVEWRELIYQEVFNEYDRGKEEVALRNLQEKVVPVSMDLLSRYEELAEHRESVIDEMGEKNIAQGEMLILVSAIISVVTVVFSIVIALFTSSIITKPLITVMNR